MLSYSSASKMVYYYQATGVSGEIDPPVMLYMGKHKEESMCKIFD